MPPIFSVETTRGGNSHELRFRQVITPEDGRRVFRLQGRELLDVLQNLRAMSIPEKDPYSKGHPGVGRLEWEMRKRCRDELDTQIEWLAGALHPRLIRDRDGIRVIGSPGMPCSANVTFFIDGIKEARTTEEVLTAGKILDQPKIQTSVGLVTPVISGEEIPLVTAAVLRAAGREAFVCAFLEPSQVSGPPNTSLGVGIFTSPESITAFACGREDPAVISMSLLADPLVYTNLMIENAGVIARQNATRYSEVEILMLRARGIIKEASEICPENPALAHYRMILTATEIDRKLMGIAEEIQNHGGIAKGGFLGIGRTPGLNSGQIVTWVKSLFDLLAETSQKIGDIPSAATQPLLTAGRQLLGFIQWLGENGMPDANCRTLMSYAQDKFQFPRGR